MDEEMPLMCGLRLQMIFHRGTSLINCSMNVMSLELRVLDSDQLEKVFSDLVLLGIEKM